jgi:hypothetical protein
MNNPVHGLKRGRCVWVSAQVDVYKLVPMNFVGTRRYRPLCILWKTGSPLPRLPRWALNTTGSGELPHSGHLHCCCQIMQNHTSISTYFIQFCILVS